ncbi:MAG: hypothetical protein AAGD25_26090 [Cyanobacteria bacterium P01_F01_bin.150]
MSDHKASSQANLENGADKARGGRGADIFVSEVGRGGTLSSILTEGAIGLAWLVI